MVIFFKAQTNGLRRQFVLSLLGRCSFEFRSVIDPRKISLERSRTFRPFTIRRKKRQCVFTNRRRSVSRLLGVSRFIAKREAGLAQIPGIFRASW